MLPWQGRRATGGGIVANLETVSEKDASIVAILRSLGAIPFVRTPEPQGGVGGGHSYYVLRAIMFF